MTAYPVDPSVDPDMEAFFDPATNTISHIVMDSGSDACALIDTVMDIDYAAGRMVYESAERLIVHVRERKLGWILETHVRADHLSAAPHIQRELGGRIGIGARITVVQETFGKVFNEGTEFQRDGSQFDALFEDGDTFQIGEMTALVMHTPGHTPACMVYVMGDAAVVGDTLFMPDGGSARADFPSGDAGQLYDTIQKVLALPNETRLFMCHDHGPGGREIAWETTVAEQRAANIHVDGPAKRATFEVKKPDEAPERVEMAFDVMHVCPPQTAPDFIRVSPLADAAGRVDVDQATLRHKTFENVWSLGDVMNAPNAKTAAAARKQAPVVAANVAADIRGRSPAAQYDGYGSCPLTVQKGKIVLAEFGYGGKLLPSFPKSVIDGTRPTRAAWHLKAQMLPPIYWKAMLRGREWMARPDPLAPITTAD